MKTLSTLLIALIFPVLLFAEETLPEVWRHEGNRILIAYNSGWVNIISFGETKFTKYSYGPNQLLNGEFDNTSIAELVEPTEAGVKHR